MTNEGRHLSRGLTAAWGEARCRLRDVTEWHESGRWQGEGTGPLRSNATIPESCRFHKSLGSGCSLTMRLLSKAGLHDGCSLNQPG